MSGASARAVTALLGLTRTVADLARSEAFYRDGLGFAAVAPPGPIPAAVREASGLAGHAGQRLRMRLGRQSLDLLAFDPPGLPYPGDPAATDPWFQHAAIVVRDMDAAYARLSALHPTPITRGGPQRLPATSGGVSAYKFRDPDGHPLELIFFPDGASAEAWAEAPGLFLGIDHSAITVTDRDAGLAFFRDGLGLTVETRSLNRGPEQAALDGVANPVVDVIGLTPSGTPTPHVELLHYRAPARRVGAPPRITARDRASTQFIFAVADFDATLAHLRATHPDHAIRVSQDHGTAGLRGPDGHGVILVRAGADPL